MRRLTLTLALVLFGSVPGAGAASPDPVAQGLRAIEEALPAIRAENDPQTRWRMLLEQTHRWRQVMALAAPHRERGYPGRAPTWGHRPDAPAQPRAPEPPAAPEGVDAPEVSPETGNGPDAARADGEDPATVARPGQPGGDANARRQPTTEATEDPRAATARLRSAALERRLAAMEERMQRQQQVLDQILQYREPIEKMLRSRGFQMPEF